MTRLIPTRDRAQATRYSIEIDADKVCERLKKEYAADGRFVCDSGGLVVKLDVPIQASPLWSGPWYVREVAE